jgi:hypothetical protein
MNKNLQHSKETTKTFNLFKNKNLQTPRVKTKAFNLFKSKNKNLQPQRQKLSQPHFGLSVRMKFTLPKVGTWSPSGLLEIQSLIPGVKTPCIGVFLISLKRP